MLSSASPASTRSRFWDILRGIGIFSVVMGHCFQPSIPYVYTYHLAVFFFVSGFLYNEQKYGYDPFGHIAAKLKASWPKYTFYMCIFTLLHNPFQYIGINAPNILYSRSQTAAFLGNSLVFSGAESMGGALWFVPMWILSCAVFGGTIWFSVRFCPDRNAGFLPLRAVLTACVSILFGTAGVFLALRSLTLSYWLHLAFLVQPFFAVGWLIRKYFPRFRHYLKWYIALFSTFFLWWIVQHYSLKVDIAICRIGNGWQYFLVAFLGIYCCMYMASLIEPIKKLGAILSLYGKYSFDVMALHFFIFKVIDVIYGRFIVNDPLEVYSAFPQAYSSYLWPFYLLLGATIPALIGAALEKAGKLHALK